MKRAQKLAVIKELLNYPMLCCCQDGNLRMILFQFTHSERLIRKNQSVKRPFKERGKILLLAAEFPWSFAGWVLGTSCSPQHFHQIPSLTVLNLSSIFTFQLLKWAVISDIQSPAVSRRALSKQWFHPNNITPPWRCLPSLWWEGQGNRGGKADFHHLQGLPHWRCHREGIGICAPAQLGVC